MEKRTKKSNKNTNVGRAKGKGRRDRRPSQQSRRASPNDKGSKSAGKISGIYRGTGRGFAFITPDSGGEDIFIPPAYLGTALNGDYIEAELFEGIDGRREARVSNVTSKVAAYVVGIFAQSKSGNPVIIPDDGKICKLFIVDDFKVKKPPEGCKVVGVPHGRNGDLLYGNIVEVLGEPNIKDVDLLSIARAYGLNEQFPPEVDQEAANAGYEVSDEELEGREDFREDCIITIDGDDTKDFDDAISVIKKGSGYELSVHIADVAHYVKQGSEIDKEAYKRATSTYFPGMVFPMLPRSLSNGICSLNPRVTRLTLSCIMDISSSGKVVKSRIVKGVIRTAHRMTYDDVTAILSGDQKLIEQYADIVEMLKLSRSLAELLHEKRKLRGCIEFELPEAKLKLDENGVCVDVLLYEHKISQQIIEEFMLIANETVATTFDKMKAPFVYRAHEPPPAEKELAFSDFLETLGISFSGGKPADYARLFESVKGMPEEKAVNKTGLRAMSKAKYTIKDSGHFGLAAPHYCHFTSPIRRYPDLQIHRIISCFLEKGSKGLKRFSKVVTPAATQSSIREQVSMTAERRATDWKKAEYMKAHIGETFSGSISSVTEWGFFVELENCVEGLVRKEALGEDTVYDAKHHRITCGEAAYCLGDAVSVICENVESGKISFKLA